MLKAVRSEGVTHRMPLERERGVDAAADRAVREHHAAAALCPVAVARDGHLAQPHVGREPDDVACRPRLARPARLPLVPLELAHAVDRPRLRVVAHAVGRVPCGVAQHTEVRAREAGLHAIGSS